MNGLVSLIVPVYNVEQYLDRCVESLVDQSYRNLEIILIDDESPDSCPEKCDEWALKDCRIKVIHKKNSGPGMARNSGLDLSTGDYIAFVDSDDYLSINAIEIMVERMERDKSSIVVSRGVKINSDGTMQAREQRFVTDNVLEKEEVLSCLGTPKSIFTDCLWGKLYRKCIFAELRFSSLRMAEDTYATPEIIDKSDKISFITDIVYYYFQRPNSIVHTKDYCKCLDRIKAVLHVCRFLFDRSYIESARYHYYAAVFYSNELKNVKEAKLLISKAFSKEERRILKKRTPDIRRSLMAYRFTGVYNFYKLLKRWIKK